MRSSGQGAWLKAQFGKLDSERMVPLDEEALALVDMVTEIRSAGRPLPHPRYGRLAEFLFCPLALSGWPPGPSRDGAYAFPCGPPCCAS